MRSRLLPLLIFSIAILWSAPSRADVPDPGHSAVDPCLVVCPQGDFAFQVIVRNIVGIPIPNSQVIVDLCGCTEVHPCPGEPCQITGLTDASGTVVFHIKAGGTCSTGAATVRADGVLLANRFVASTDQNGDLFVDASDVAIGVGKIGSGDYTGDLDCDGAVTSADVTIIREHGGHMCGAVPTLPSSWGRVKAIYR